jgi:hypothetical protein
MVKLTVMYTLPEGADHRAFLQWRTTEHQEENMGIPGVIKSDFYAVREIYTHAPGDTDSVKEKKSGGLPPSQEPVLEQRVKAEKTASETLSKGQEPTSKNSLQAHSLVYRYITEAYWPDMQSFKSAFFDSGYQKRLMESLKKIANPIFLVSEEVLSAMK